MDCQVGKVNFTATTLHAAVESIIASIGSQHSNNRYHFANAFNVALAQDDENYRAVLNRSTSTFMDGVPVVAVARKVLKRSQSLTSESIGRVYGPDVMEALLSSKASPPLKHYFLGGSEETLQALVTQVSSRWPQAQIVGSASPPFSAPTQRELEARDRAIEDSGANCVWIGLGTPKQDYEAQRITESLGVTTLSVGAAFDFLAGTKQQAPKWMQKGGLEWLFRLASEPRRMVKRYLWGNTQFLLITSRQLLRRSAA